ncbi:MAG: tail tape measure protein [Pseudomonadota bacterium]
MDSFPEEGDFAGVSAGVGKADDALRTLGTSFRDVGKEGAQFNAVLASGVDKLAGNMTDAFERFARTGKLSFDDLKNVAISALDDIYNQSISAGINSIFGGDGSSGGGGLFGNLVQGVLTSFAPRAQGGPVTANRPYLIGEKGPELFIPGANGQVAANAVPAQSAPIAITINMSGAAPTDMRQSASQIASQVSRAVARAQRNG